MEKYIWYGVMAIVVILLIFLAYKLILEKKENFNYEFPTPPKDILESGDYNYDVDEGQPEDFVGSSSSCAACSA